MRGVVLAGTASGVGKTVATLALCRALENAGHDVQPAKAGPDFVDPSHHAELVGTPSRTLDVWLEGAEGLRRNYHRGTGDVCVVEGVMGLYDGSVSSTAAVAEALDLPVVLVVDASAGMESVAATALGFREYADAANCEIDVAGVIAQRAHGGRHERGIRDALPDALSYLGRIPPDDDLAIPERHLGLHMGSEAPIPRDALDAAAESLDVDGLVALAREPPRPDAERGERRGEGRGAGRDGGATDATVAVARDPAFCFVYPATLERLRARATVETFSPVAGDPLPAADAVYLPGGYPERFAADLADSDALAALADRAAEGLPILGECGGMMALAESLTVDAGSHGADGGGHDGGADEGGHDGGADDRDGRDDGTDGEGSETYDMAGVLPATVTMHDRHRALDHVELRARRDAPTAAAGETLRGHEFHYSSADVASDARFAFDVERGDGIDGDRDGLVEHRTLGTYAHVHAESGAFDRLLDGL